MQFHRSRLAPQKRTKTTVAKAGSQRSPRVGTGQISTQPKKGGTTVRPGVRPTSSLDSVFEEVEDATAAAAPMSPSEVMRAFSSDEFKDGIIPAKATRGANKATELSYARTFRGSEFLTSLDFGRKLGAEIEAIVREKRLNKDNITVIIEVTGPKNASSISTPSGVGFTPITDEDDLDDLEDAEDLPVLTLAKNQPPSEPHLQPISDPGLAPMEEAEDALPASEPRMEPVRARRSDPALAPIDASPPSDPNIAPLDED
jgi:hypothetical protein